MIVNKKGFTMVELLGTIVVLSILMLLGIISVNKLIERSKVEQLVHQKQTLKAAAEAYAQDNETELPASIGEKNTIMASVLKDSKYLKNDIYNSKKESCMEKSYVIIYKSSKNKYNYTPVLCCGTEACEEASESTVKPVIKAFFTDNEGKDFSTLSAEEKEKLINDVNNIYIKFDLKGSSDNSAKIMSYSFSISAKINEGNRAEVYSSGVLSTNESKHIEVFKKISEYVDITGKTDFSLEVSAVNNLGGTNTVNVDQFVKDSIVPTCTNITVEPSIAQVKWINKYSTVKRKVVATCNDSSGSGCIRDTFIRIWPNNKQQNAEYAYIQVKDNAGHVNVPDNYLTENLCNLPYKNDTCRVAVNVDTEAPSLEVTSNGYDGKKAANNNANLVINAGDYKNLKNGWVASGSYNDGLTFTITAKDNIHLDKWVWQTGNTDEKTGTFSGSSNNSNCGLREGNVFTVNLKVEGKRSAKLMVYDKAGNHTDVIVKANIDRTPPTVKSGGAFKVQPYANNSGTALSGEYKGDYTNKHIGFVVVKSNIVDTLSGYDYTMFNLCYPNVNTVINSQNQTDRYNVMSTNRNGTYIVTYKLCDKASNCSSTYQKISDIKFDTQAPKCKLTVSGKKISGSTYFKSNVVVTITKSDNLSGFGSKSWGVSKSKTATYNGKNSITLKSAKNTIVYGYVKDKVGNTSSCKTSKIGIDTAKPSCKLKIVGVLGKNDWYKEKKVTIQFKEKVDKESGIAKYYLTKDKNGKKSFPSKNANSATQGNTKKVRWYGFVQDKAGLKGSCYIDVKVDTEAPKCIGRPYGGTPAPGRYSGNRNCGTRYIQKASDNLSGLNAANTSSKHCYIEIPIGVLAPTSWGRVCHNGVLKSNHKASYNRADKDKVFSGLNAKNARVKVQMCPGDAAGNQTCCSSGTIYLNYSGANCGAG